MGVIKASQAPTAAVPFSMKDIENHAKGILLRAQQQAEQLLAAAQVEAEALKEQAQAQGFAEGKAAGFIAGREDGLKAGRDQALSEQRPQLTAVVGALTKAVGEIEANRLQIRAAAQQDVIALAIAIAQRVTKRQGVLDAETAIANVAEALSLVTHASDIRIAIHPTQKAVLADALPRLKLQLPRLEHVELIEDAQLAPGGCRVFTADGQIDGDLDTQLGRIVAELLPETT